MKHERVFIVDVLFVLALFGVFTVSALMLVTIGAEVYRNTVDDMGRNYEARISIAYITEKIRQNDSLPPSSDADSSNEICISTLDGEPALLMTQETDGEHYLTYLYLYDGFLKELYVRSGSDIGGDIRAAGQNIIKLSSLKLEQVTDNLLSIEMITPAGKKHHIYAFLHCAP